MSRDNLFGETLGEPGLAETIAGCFSCLGITALALYVAVRLVMLLWRLYG